MHDSHQAGCVGRLPSEGQKIVQTEPIHAPGTVIVRPVIDLSRDGSGDDEDAIDLRSDGSGGDEDAMTVRHDPDPSQNALNTAFDEGSDDSESSQICDSAVIGDSWGMESSCQPPAQAMQGAESSAQGDLVEPFWEPVTDASIDTFIQRAGPTPSC
jgi:hypothetical protein